VSVVMTAGETGRWLPFGTGRAARVRLLCLPHAGGGASVYRAWGAGLPADIAVCPIQLPGRESRLHEQPYRQIPPLVTDLASVLDEVVQPYALFGHSMGAIVAFELVREIRKRGAPAPVHLFVSGRHAPQLPDPHPGLRNLPVDQLAGVLRAFGGTPEEVLADLGLLEVIAPLLRADFCVNETYRYVEQRPLDVPVTAFVGASDPRASTAQVAAWGEQTTRSFRTYVLPGGHFAVLDQAPFVCGRVAERLASDAVGGGGATAAPVSS
jgi:medium-chain acyl-[acyl-carrier-protein] hydrolase